MRSRDLKKLKPGTRVKITLTKDNLLDAPFLKTWTTKTVYFHGIDAPGWFEVRTSKKIGKFTKIEPFVSREIQIAKE